MKKLTLLLAAFTFISFASPALADGPQVTVNVQGLVCSFCAVGATKQLSKIDGLDHSVYTKGVFVDIENQIILLAFQEGAAVPVDEIRERVAKAGYEALSVEIDVAEQ